MGVVLNYRRYKALKAHFGHPDNIYPPDKHLLNEVEKEIGSGDPARIEARIAEIEKERAND